jgi:hypothetical protein
MIEQQPITTVIMILNIILGTGPMIVPSVILKGGWRLSSVFTVLTGSMSLVSGMFVVEAVSIANGLLNCENSKRQKTETL